MQFQGAVDEQENRQDAHQEDFEVEFELDALMSLGEAAKELGMTQAGVFRAIERGVLRPVIDEEKDKHHGSTRDLREDVMRLKKTC